MVLEKIKDILENELGKDRNEITLDSDIIKDLGLDSLDIVTLIMAVEDGVGWGRHIPSVPPMTTKS